MTAEKPIYGTRKNSIERLPVNNVRKIRRRKPLTGSKRDCQFVPSNPVTFGARDPTVKKKRVACKKYSCTNPADQKRCMYFLHMYVTLPDRKTEPSLATGRSPLY